MPRTSRQHSDTGVYHVMLRGIDRQDIFADDQDRGKLHQKNRPYFHSGHVQVATVTDALGNVSKTHVDGSGGTVKSTSKEPSLFSLMLSHMEQKRLNKKLFRMV